MFEIKICTLKKKGGCLVKELIKIDPQKIESTEKRNKIKKVLRQACQGCAGCLDRGVYRVSGTLHLLVKVQCAVVGALESARRNISECSIIKRKARKKHY